MKIRLLAFATARQALGQDEIEIELAESSSVADLVGLLEDSHPELAALWPRLAIAVDGELVTRDSLLEDGAEVALLPPVSGGVGAMRSALVDDSIDLGPLIRSVSHPSCGAVVLFTGNVRDRNRGRPVDRIAYHAYRPMAATALETIAEQLESSPDISRVRIVHRLGEVPVGETSVAIVVASPHRDSAFRTSRQALERLKKEVPIWKLEHYSDGGIEWREEEPLRTPVSNLV